MPSQVRTLTLTDEQRSVLRSRVRARGESARVVKRTRVVLLAAEGVPGVEIAERVGRLHTAEDVVGGLQPAQGVDLVLLLQLVPRLDAADQLMHDLHDERINGWHQEPGASAGYRRRARKHRRAVMTLTPREARLPTHRTTAVYLRSPNCADRADVVLCPAAAPP